jgi:hypothetical protein
MRGIIGAEGEQITDQMYVAGGFAEVTPGVAPFWRARCTADDLSRREASGAGGGRCALRRCRGFGRRGGELALERIQSAQALVERVDTLMTGGR